MRFVSFEDYYTGTCFAVPVNRISMISGNDQAFVWLYLKGDVIGTRIKGSLSEILASLAACDPPTSACSVWSQPVEPNAPTPPWVTPFYNPPNICCSVQG